MGSDPIEVGSVFNTVGRTIGEGDINLFAGLVGDFGPLHSDEVYARSTIFGGRIAHGGLIMATALGMLTQTGVLNDRAMGMVNVQWDFSKPVKIGDTIRARVTVSEVRRTSKNGRLLATFSFDVMNQLDDVVQRGRASFIVKSI